MWTTESLWFEIAIVSIIYAIGNIIFGHFEEQTPKLRRVGKYILTLIIIIAISLYFGRSTAMIILGAFLIPVVYSWFLFAEEKRYQWIDGRTEKQIL